MKKLVILSLSLGSSLLALTSCGKVGNDRGQGDSSSSTTTSPSGDVSPTDPAITQLNQEITLLQTQVTNLNTQITTMTNNTDPALAAEIAELKKEYTTINTELTVLLALQSQATKNATDITNLTAQYNSLNILVQNLMNEVTPSNLNPAQKTIRQNYLNGNVMFPIEIVGLVNKKSFDQLIKISMYNTTNNIAGDISFSANTFFNLPNTITQDSLLIKTMMIRQNRHILFL